MVLKPINEVTLPLHLPIFKEKAFFREAAFLRSPHSLMLVELVDFCVLEAYHLTLVSFLASRVVLGSYATM
jgi:hypothetical protein